VWWRRALQGGLTALHLACYRATGGAIGHRLGPLPHLLLTTTGRRSGRPRTTVLTYLRTAGLLALVASNFGSRTAPQWFRNLEAHPEARVQLKRSRWVVHTRPATAEERARIWAAALAIWPAWASYATRAQRPIPMVVLEPAEPAAPPPRG
jgi:deazaflavin-dependent oxidoreductase (nitroreductase family)